MSAWVWSFLNGPNSRSDESNTDAIDALHSQQRMPDLFITRNHKTKSRVMTEAYVMPTKPMAEALNTRQPTTIVYSWFSYGFNPANGLNTPLIIACAVAAFLALIAAAMIPLRRKSKIIISQDPYESL